MSTNRVHYVYTAEVIAKSRQGKHKDWLPFWVACYSDADNVETTSDIGRVTCKKCQLKIDHGLRKGLPL